MWQILPSSNIFVNPINQVYVALLDVFDIVACAFDLGGQNFYMKIRRLNLSGNLKCYFFFTAWRNLIVEIQWLLLYLPHPSFIYSFFRTSPTDTSPQSRFISSSPPKSHSQPRFISFSPPKSHCATQISHCQHPLTSFFILLHFFFLLLHKSSESKWMVMKVVIRNSNLKKFKGEILQKP